MNLGFLFVILLAASEIKVRSRPATAALNGSADLEVVGELAVWSLVTFWLALKLTSQQVRSKRVPGAAAQPKHRVGALRALTLVGLLDVAASLYAPRLISLVRAVQIVVLIELTVYTASVLQRSWTGALWFTRGLRRGLTVVVLSLTALSVVVSHPLLDPDTGVLRYRWLEMHPITTGTLLGLVILVEAAGLIPLAGGRPNALLGRSYTRQIAFVALCAALLYQTRARGAQAATLAAIVVMFSVGSPKVLRRVVLGVAVASLCVLLWAPRLVESEIVTRGQTTAELTSVSGRDQIFREASRLFGQAPLTGHGYLSGRSIFLAKIPWAGESHNVLVEIMVSTGLLGLAVYLNLFASWWRDMHRVPHMHRAPHAEFFRLSSGLVTYLMFTGVVSDGFAAAPGTATVALCLAILLASVPVLRGVATTART